MFILSPSYASVSGEIITYNIKKLGLKAGETTIVYGGPTKLDGKDTILITVTADGFNFFDEEKIYLDPVSFYPVVVKRNLNIFGNKEKINEYYDQQKSEVRIVNITKKEELVIKKSGKIDNIYGFIYRYRNKGEFEIGKKIDMQLPTQDVSLSFKKRTTIKAAGLKYDAFYMQGNPGNIKIWFDLSDEKIPVRIDGAIGFGSTKMIMKRYEKASQP
ncbi:MAG: DUF3108 domain-containing protein [Candidatus Zapsychrus exili]|nr:DUF3108 domain-containing protein [Candidatus Zapsychrus exili]